MSPGKGFLGGRLSIITWGLIIIVGIFITVIILGLATGEASVEDLSTFSEPSAFFTISCPGVLLIISLVVDLRRSASKRVSRTWSAKGKFQSGLFKVKRIANSFRRIGHTRDVYIINISMISFLLAPLTYTAAGVAWLFVCLPYHWIWYKHKKT
ncbi:hypothetical protein KQH62_02870 [bacterium]|nr:hypothetical protein [bacterium]